MPVLTVGLQFIHDGWKHHGHAPLQSLAHAPQAGVAAVDDWELSASRSHQRQRGQPVRRIRSSLEVHRDQIDIENRH